MNETFNERYTRFFQQLQGNSVVSTDRFVLSSAVKQSGLTSLQIKCFFQGSSEFYSLATPNHIKLGRRHRSDFNAAFSPSYLCDVISLFMSFCCARQLLRTPHVHAHPSVWVGSHLHKSKYFGKIFSTQWASFMKCPRNILPVNASYLSEKS